MGGACGSSSKSSGSKSNSSVRGKFSDRENSILETKHRMHQRFLSDSYKTSIKLDSPWAHITSNENINLVYEPLEQVGEGFTGKVYRAGLKGYPKRQFAIKSIRKSINTDKAFKYFRGEVEMLKELDHPHIVRFFECYQDSDNFYLVVELCLGLDLVKIVEKTRGLNEFQAKRFFHQALLAVNYLHSVGIAHRDIKLDNFLLSTADERTASLKLIDFGFAKNFREGDLYSQVGTPWYVAPEVLAKNASYSPLCDNWSLGVMLYIMIFAEPPFKGRNNSEIFTQVKEKEIDYTHYKFKLFDPEVIVLMRGLLAKNPSERLTLSEALQSSWFNSIIVELHQNWDSGTIKHVISRLKGAKIYSRFKREVVKIMVKIFHDSKELREAENLFYCCDYLNNGIITPMEVEHLLSEGKEPCKEETIKKIIDNLYLRTKDVVTFSEFVAGVVSKSFFTDHLRLKITFDRFDIDHSGYITEENIMGCFQRFGYSLSENTVKQLIADFDIYKDGVISYEEFVKVMKKD